VATERPGVVVDDVVPGHAAHRAGVREGDVLDVASPPELAALARRSAAGQDVRVRRLGGGEELSFPRADWGVEVRPALAPAEERRHRSARAAAAAGRFDEAERAWAALASEHSAAGRATDAAFFHLRRAGALLGKGDAERARAAGGAAIETAAAGGPAVAAWAAQAWADTLARANQHALADQAYERALSLTAEGDGIARATLLQKRAIASFRRNRFDEAAERARAALRAWEAHAPRSNASAATLLTLARVERNHGRYGTATRLVDRALAAAHDADPGGPGEATALSEHGVIAYRQGRTEEEERWYRRALDLFNRLGVRDTDVGRVHVFLGNAAYTRADVAGAEEHYRRGLEIFEGESPESLHVGWALLGLGDVLMARGDLGRAEQAFRRSTAIRATLVPGAPDHAVSLQNLGTALLARGDHEGAERAFRDALDILERTVDEPFDRAILLANLGDVLTARGRFDEARALLGRSLALFRAHAPGGPEHGDGLFALGTLEQRRGRLPEAERAYRDALAIRSRLASGGAAEADALFAIGVLERRSERREAAVATLRRAVAALEAQRRRLGGTPEDGARFSATYAHVHKELLDLLLELGRDEAAFGLLERYRVGSLGTMVARRALHRGQPASTTGQDPRPPTSAEAARLLDDGTLLLSFAVLPERTILFAIAGGPAASLAVHELPLSEARLRTDVETLRDLLQSPRAPAEGQRALRGRLRTLHDALLGPVRESVARSRRVIVLPDGPLHLVPFGALASADVPRLRHLVQDRPVARAQAITLLARPQAVAPESRTPLRLLAFGDPGGPAHLALPRARAEVEALGRLYAGEGRVFVGTEATESRAKAASGGARYLHFASHGVTDDRFPLDSYLALGASGDGRAREDGRLQGWEVCEQVRLGADLVVLSACDTGLGAELAGAGLLGLTYAFQFAGARSVVASLWPVSDRSTAPLMRAFHERMRRGERPAQALREAQLELMSRPIAPDARLAGGLRRLLRMPRPEDLPLDASHPYYWAAFQLFGSPL
jgi:CHAT domain-containing protein/tetratricopeptide (TPR) repeat protein